LTILGVPFHLIVEVVAPALYLYGGLLLISVVSKKLKEKERNLPSWQKVFLTSFLLIAWPMLPLLILMTKFNHLE
jgi:hypothetical protein